MKTHMSPQGRRPVGAPLPALPGARGRARPSSCTLLHIQVLLRCPGCLSVRKLGQEQHPGAEWGAHKQQPQPAGQEPSPPRSAVCWRGPAAAPSVPGLMPPCPPTPALHSRPWGGLDERGSISNPPHPLCAQGVSLFTENTASGPQENSGVGRGPVAPLSEAAASSLSLPPGLPELTGGLQGDPIQQEPTCSLRPGCPCPQGNPPPRVERRPLGTGTSQSRSGVAPADGS